MKNGKPKLWAKIDDDRSEHLNGGAGTMKFYIGGGIGAAQPLDGDEVQMKLFPACKTHKHYGFYLYKCTLPIE